ncbi:hypothetical protein [Nocardioides sp. KR10-350]|uniref:hypothetical protein n=1 Tax=Nocardioides cheoyonin TaxID=3156615 RepID=UPI0032B419F1
MTVVLEPTVEDLDRERAELLDEIRFTEAELRDRAASYRLTTDEARVLRRLDEIAYLLGDDD